MNHRQKPLSACLLAMAALLSTAPIQGAWAQTAPSLGTASNYALTTSAGLTASIGTALVGPTFGGNAALDSPAPACTSTAAALVLGADGNTCALANFTTPGFAIAGGLAITGTTIRFKATNAAAENAAVRAVKDAVNAAWLDAFNRVGGASIAGPGALGGKILPPGVYTSGSTMTLGSGETLTLDAGAGNANAATAVWIFQVGSSLTITGSTVACGAGPVCTPTQVVLLNGALAKNVFWQVGTPRSAAGASIGGDVSFPAATGPVENNTIFKGTILAGNTVTFAGGTAVEGRVLAGADLLGTPNTQTGGAVTATGGSTGPVTVTLPQ